MIPQSVLALFSCILFFLLKHSSHIQQDYTKTIVWNFSQKKKSFLKIKEYILLFFHSHLEN